MPTILLFNNQTGRLERFSRAMSEPMPYNTGGTLKVSEFTVGREYPIIWTDLDTMRAYNDLRAAFGNPIRILRGFRRLSEDYFNNHIHLHGKALLMQPLSGTAQSLLCAAQQTGQAGKAELADGGVYFDTRYMSCGTNSNKRGLPNLEPGDRNNFVALLQDLLNIILGATLVIDGIFGPATERELRCLQNEILLAEDAIVTLVVWESLLNMASGKANW